MRLNVILGVAGVHASESEQALRIGRRFEILVLMALLVVFAQLIMLYSGALEDANWVTDLVWGVFLSELLVNLYFVKRRWRYLRENWLNVAIVFLAFPLINWGSDWATIIRSLRLILFIRFFANFSKDFIAILGRNRFGQILLGTAFIVLGAGGIFAFIEDREYIDGIWYALVTITTVGYGDVVPATEAGRLFGFVLIIFGVVFFSLVTANISAYLIGSDQKQLEKEILQYVKQTEQRLAKQQSLNEEHVEKIIIHMSKEIKDLKKELTKNEHEKIKRESQSKLDKRV